MPPVKTTPNSNIYIPYLNCAFIAFNWGLKATLGSHALSDKKQKWISIIELKKAVPTRVVWDVYKNTHFKGNVKYLNEMNLKISCKPTDL